MVGLIEGAVIGLGGFVAGAICNWFWHTRYLEDYA